MTRVAPRSKTGWRQPPPVRTPRLRLKPKALPTGYVDGAWWPGSVDLTNELPDLLAVLSVRLGPISCVAYQVGEWGKTPATLLVGDRAVRLAGYRRRPRNTVEILGVGGTSIVVLVVPPGSDPERAHSTMMAAAAPNNAVTISGLLASGRR